MTKFDFRFTSSQIFLHKSSIFSEFHTVKSREINLFLIIFAFF